MGAAAGAMLVCAPIASADDPPPCNPGDAQMPTAAAPGSTPRSHRPCAQGDAGAADRRQPDGRSRQRCSTACTPPVASAPAVKRINGVPTYIPPQGLTLPTGAQVGPPTACIESVKETGCAPDCMPRDIRYLFDEGRRHSAGYGGRRNSCQSRKTRRNRTVSRESVTPLLPIRRLRRRRFRVAPA